MSHNRTLVDAIKATFAGKSAAQLRAIKRGEKPARWSPEAVVAAVEVLDDRRAGRAQEPAHPDTDDEPLNYQYDPDLMALGILSGLFTGVMVVPNPRAREGEPLDLPVPFGSNMAWVAVASTDTEAVATALGVRNPTRALWWPGVEAAHRGSVFVTPPVGDWTLALGTTLFFPPDGFAAGVHGLLADLGGRFEEAQYFASHRAFELFVWGVNRGGELERGYGWLGAERRLLWDAGTLTELELALGFQLGAGQPPQVEADGLTAFTEDHLFQLASNWSIDPTTLDVEFAEPASGLLGKLPR
jgi:hypothetical protein